MGALDQGVAAVTRWGAALRGKRLMHPAGVTFDGTFTVAPGTSHDVPLLAQPATYRAVVRLSKATSTPPGRPDVLGLAWRVVDAGGPGVSLDIALSTTGRAVLARHLLVPKRDFATSTFTSLLPYRIAGHNRYLAALPQGGPGLPADVAALPAAIAARPLVLSVGVASLTSAWQPVATLTVDQPTDEDPAFNVVVNSLPGFAPTGWINHLRESAYRGSQQGRGASARP